ncbi:MAG: VCBS repeat-containing protein, partial [Gemmatimonadota bacterium]|nr:VCBS repeat-containing protein [Gemmatimonadota bacterium]
MIPITVLCVALLAACDAPAPTPASAHFSEMAAASGLHFEMRSGGQVKNYILESKGGGGAFIDYNSDGWLDIYLVNGAQLGSTAPPNALYRNQGNGAFADHTQAAGVGDDQWGMGCAVGDYDNDGASDLYVTNYGPNSLYHNEGDGTFREVGQAAGVDLADWSTSATFGDYDRDGDLDLYVAQYLQFAPERVPPRGGMWKGVLVFAGPLGLTGAQDALYRNEGDGTFR